MKATQRKSGVSVRPDCELERLSRGLRDREAQDAVAPPGRIRDKALARYYPLPTIGDDLHLEPPASAQPVHHAAKERFIKTRPQVNVRAVRNEPLNPSLRTERHLPAVPLDPAGRANAQQREERELRPHLRLGDRGDPLELGMEREDGLPLDALDA